MINSLEKLPKCTQAQIEILNKLIVEEIEIIINSYLPNMYHPIWIRKPIMPKS